MNIKCNNTLKWNIVSDLFLPVIILWYIPVRKYLLCGAGASRLSQNMTYRLHLPVAGFDGEALQKLNCVEWVWCLVQLWCYGSPFFLTLPTGINTPPSLWVPARTRSSAAHMLVIGPVSGCREHVGHERSGECQRFAGWNISGGGTRYAWKKNMLCEWSDYVMNVIKQV